MREFDKDQSIFSYAIILLILITLLLDIVWILLGENWCWSVLGLEGLTGNHWLCTDSWFLTGWVPGHTIAICNKITELVLDHQLTCGISRMQFRYPTVLLVKSCDLQTEGVIIHSLLSALNTLFYYLYVDKNNNIEMFHRSSRLCDGRGWLDEIKGPGRKVWM